MMNAILLLFLDPEWFPALLNRITSRRVQAEPASQPA